MLNLTLAQDDANLRPRIMICGVGGAGGNAVNNMMRNDLSGVDFCIYNTDSQAISSNMAPTRIQLGSLLTKGLGAGARPEVGRAAAEEQMDEIIQSIQGANMVFIAAGMGGGTGTGAAPVIARAARELGILTVGVVTKPFSFEGAHRMRLAEAGIQELQQYVDTLIIIPNQNLFRLADITTTFADAFKMADDVLHSGVRGVTDLITMPGLINLDFADIRSVMSEMGKAMMGTGEAEGSNRAIDAAEKAINNPLLDEVSMKGARGVLINITGGADMTLYEVDAAANRIREEVDPDANIIFGSTYNPELTSKIRVSVVATGIDAALMQQRPHSSSATTQTGYQSQPAVSSSQPFSMVQNRSYPTNTTPYTPAPTYQAQTVPPRSAAVGSPATSTPSSTNASGYTQLTPQTTPPVSSSHDDTVRDMPLQGETSAPTETSMTGTYSQPSSQPGFSQTSVTPQATVSDGSFIAPAPISTGSVIPGAQSFVPQQPSPQSQSYNMTSGQQSPNDQQGSQQGQGNMNFEERARRKPSVFERVGISLGLQHQSPPQSFNQQTGAPTDSTGTSQPQTEEELEIPAFLRRQSN